MNIFVFCQSKERRSGFSTATQLPHTGMIYYCQLVQDAPADLRRKVSGEGFIFELILKSKQLAKPIVSLSEFTAV